MMRGLMWAIPISLVLWAVLWAIVILVARYI